MSKGDLIVGDLIVLSAPSGTGKTTLIQGVLNGDLAGFGVSSRVGKDIVFSVSHTTRRPRRGEVDGQDYHFVDQTVFEEMVAAGRFLEWATVHGKLYGTSRDEVMKRLERGADVILDIDVQGAEQVLRNYPEAVSIFIMPPSYTVLEERLSRRGLDDADEVQRRLAVSRWEIERYERYQYVIINDDLERASHVLAAIILEKRHRAERMNEIVSGVLEDFAARTESAPPAAVAGGEEE